MKTPQILIMPGDITQQAVDAIINAANPSLLGGGGVDGAIHRAAGPDLLAECRCLGGCQTGEAKITQGYQLPADWIIHTVGPIWQGGNHGESQHLAQCYRHCLTLAEKYEIRTLAFPAISTGIYGFPLQPAAEIAIKEVKKHLENSSSIEQVRFICFDQTTYDCYLRTFKNILLGNVS